MIAVYFIPGLLAFLNRYWRGEGRIPRWLWHIFHFGLAYITTFNLQFALAWLLFSIGYSAFSWQAMFSAVTGRQPGRRDSWYIDWMQTLAYKLNKGVLTPTGWQRFGTTYGTIRATLMLPGIIAITSIIGWIGLIGLLCLSMGLIYRYSATIRDHFELPEDKAIAIAEVIMGYLIGTYMLICAVSL